MLQYLACRRGAFFHTAHEHFFMVLALGLGGIRGKGTVGMMRMQV